MENYYEETLNKFEYEQWIIEKNSEKKILRLQEENANLLREIMTLKSNFTKTVSEKDQVENYYLEKLNVYMNEHGEIETKEAEIIKLEQENNRLMKDLKGSEYINTQTTQEKDKMENFYVDVVKRLQGRHWRRARVTEN